MIGEFSKNTRGSQYFNCQNYSHVVAQCSSRSLLVREADNNEIETLVYDPTVSATDSDDNVSVSII